MATFSYGGDPAANNNDEVRFLVQDTDSDEWLFSNEEVSYAVAEEGSNQLAAALLFEVLASWCLRRPGFSIARYREDPMAQADKLLARAQQLRTQAYEPGFYAGAITQTDKEAEEADTDRTLPSFQRDQFKFKSINPLTQEEEN